MTHQVLDIAPSSRPFDESKFNTNIRSDLDASQQPMAALAATKSHLDIFKSNLSRLT